MQRFRAVSQIFGFKIPASSNVVVKLLGLHVTTVQATLTRMGRLVPIGQHHVFGKDSLRENSHCSCPVALQPFCLNQRDSQEEVSSFDKCCVKPLLRVSRSYRGH